MSIYNCIQVNSVEKTIHVRQFNKKLAKNHHMWPIATHTGALYAGHKIRAGRFQFHEDGIRPPASDTNPIRNLKYHMRALNPDRTVEVLDEEAYVESN